MSRTRSAPVIGWFGKIPALGDFAARGLPPDFTQSWDAWLSAQLHDARLCLGEAAWSVAYDRAPALCFTVNDGVLDEHRWCGIIAPSRDRVARRFPLTIACSWPTGAATAPRSAWWSAVTAAVERARQPGGRADALDLELRSIPLQSPEAAVVPGLGPSPDQWPSLGASRWWAPSVAGGVVCGARDCSGMPSGETFRSLLKMI